jgi:hypothetical protein
LNQAKEIAKISNPKSIESLLQKMANAKLDVLLRSSMDSKVAVRGKILGLSPLATQPVFNISQISKRGLDVIKGWTSFQIQIIGTSALTTFSSIGKIQGELLQIQLPKEILSINRRESARSGVNPNKSSFVRLAKHQPTITNVNEAPIIDIFGDAGAFLSIIDISLSGVCLVTNFSHVYDTLGAKAKDEGATLILPMLARIPVGVELRWKKHVRETLPGLNHRARFYKFGFQFLSLTRENAEKIKVYIHQLNLADAI